MKKIQETLNKWNSEKFWSLNLTQNVGKLGAWLELIHDTKEFGVYADFGLNRGFSADSDALESPSKSNLTPVLNCNTKKDSWSATIREP